MANGTISPSLIYLPRTCHLEENKTLCYVCHKRRVRCAYPPYGDEANVRFCMAGALALTRSTVMRLMSGFAWRVRCAYPPYENA